MDEKRERSYVLDRVTDNVSNDLHVTLLPHPMNSVDCLFFRHGVPVRLDNVHRVGGSEFDSKKLDISMH